MNTRADHPRNASRRGTVLILVLGVLALLAVITAVYAAIGTADRRTGDTLRRSSQIDDVAREVTDHVSGILASDVLSTTVVPGIPQNNQVRLTRETTDYPYTDFTRRSMVPQIAQRPFLRFDPAGTHSAPLPRGTTVDNRVASDPFLASTEPEYLSIDGSDDVSAGNPKEYYLNFRDWKQISNIAPDGRFVNLFNLRPQGVGFDAPSRWLSGIRGPGDSPARTPERLTLFDWKSPGQDQPDPTNLLDFNDAPADPNIPAHWTMRQRNAFRPLNDTLHTWEDPEYLAYQWADADGDGMADARWTELVDESDPRAPRSLIRSGPPDTRWFVAARIIDLSGLVNVNTASDGLTPPTVEVPAGLTPAEVDLRRLLSLSDVRLETDFAYDALEQPAPTPEDPANDLREYTDAGSRLWSTFVGLNAYGSVSRTLALGASPSNDFDAGNDVKYPGGLYADWSLGRFQVGTADSGLIDRWNGQLRRLFAYQDAAAWQLGGAFGTGAERGYFGASDLIELLTYRGVNDPEQFSRLEYVMSGRALGTHFGSTGNWSDGTPRTSRFSPLRSARSLRYEREGRANQTSTSQRVAGIDYDALFHSTADVRQRLTTLSGARPLRPITTPNTSELQSEELPGSLADLVDNGDLPAIYRRISNGLLGAADEHLGASATWSSAGVWPDISGGSVAQTGNFNQFCTLFYGSRGPELPLNLAAHLAVNLFDAADSDNEPTVYTALFDKSIRNTLESDVGQVIGNRNPLYQWSVWADNKRLDTPDRLLATNAGTLQAHSPLKNFYGIEAQPVLVQTVMYTAYSDVSKSLGGDDEDSIVGGRFAPTIQGSVDASNPDFLFQFVAFQLTNPFNEEVRLTDEELSDGAPAGASQFLYYIRFAGRTFKIADHQLDGTGEYLGGGGQLNAVTLAPGETRWFYYMNRSPNFFENRFDKVATEAPASLVSRPDWVRDFIAAQLNLGPTADPPALLVEFDAATGSLSVPASGSFVAPEDLRELGLGVDASERQVVRLIRAMRVSQGEEAGVGDNFTGNDLVVDRLRLPATAAGLFGTGSGLPSSGQNEVSNASGDSNAGYTLAVVESVRRRGEGPVPEGGIASYFVESVDPAASGWANEVERNYDPATFPTKSDFDGTGVFELGSETFRTFVDDYIDGVGGVTVALHPEAKQVPSDWTDTLPSNADGRGFAVLRPKLVLDNIGFDRVFTQPAGGEQRLPTLLRVSDIIKMLAIGPSFDPTRTSARGPADDTRWMTLGEALALAMNYDSGALGPLDVPGAAAALSRYPMFKIGNRSASTPELRYVFPALERGQLVLDDYTPFVNVSDIAGTPFQFNAGDRVRGLGIPAALAVIEQFRTLERYVTDSAPDPVNGYSLTAREPLGGLQELIPGKININTAPLRVLRLLPMLSPTQADFPSGPAAGSSEWWGEHPAGLNVTTFADDIAARLVAYRDKLNGFRTRDDGAGNITSISYGEVGSGVLSDPATWNGRRSTFNAGIGPAVRPAGVREQPGFASVAELMMLTDRSVAGPEQTSIDQLGRDGVSLVGSVVASGRVSADGRAVRNSAGDIVDDGTIDDIDEKLAVFDAVANSVTVRSDTFACWFVLHGYRRADVERLRDRDPLIPSVARRFLVVFDRSNVVRAGDRPRIVVFKEVPM